MVDFYYNFKKNYAWLFLNIFALVIIVGCTLSNPCLFFWWQTQTLFGVTLFSLFIWCYKYLVKQKAVIISEDGIKIDFCNILYWKDIKNAEEKIHKICSKEYNIIVLTPEDDIKYKYNLLQKYNCGFQPFSIPLYALSDEDNDKIFKILENKIKIKRLKQ